MIQRSVTSGTQNMIATAIEIAASWYGVFHSTTSTVYTALQAANSANDDWAIGIMAAEDVDGYRLGKDTVDGGVAPNVLRELAYQHKGQNCGYLPDSTSSSFDKRDVRTGLYAISARSSAAGHRRHQRPAHRQRLAGHVGAGQHQSGRDRGEARHHPAVRYARAARHRGRPDDTPRPGSTACGCYYEEVANNRRRRNSTRPARRARRSRTAPTAATRARSTPTWGRGSARRLTTRLPALAPGRLPGIQSKGRRPGCKLTRCVSVSRGTVNERRSLGKDRRLNKTNADPSGKDRRSFPKELARTFPAPDRPAAPSMRQAS